MLKNIELTRKSLAVDDYDDARAALLQAQAITKLLSVGGTVLDDAKCVSITASVLEDLLERVEKRLETASSL